MEEMPEEAKTILAFTPLITGASVETIKISLIRHLW
jgi:hypothetical protein